MVAKKPVLRYNRAMEKIFLSPKQLETLNFIKDFIKKHKMSPTIAEIKDEFGLDSIRSVMQRIEGLEKKGFLKRDKFKHRNITLIDPGLSSPPGMVQIPVIASAGCDAMQVFANETFDEFLTVEKSLTDPRKEIVAIKAIGGSMVDAGIQNGDYVLVEVTQDVSLNDRVVTIIGDMAVIKRFKRANGMVILTPEAKGYNPIVIKEENSRIFGKVLSVIPTSGHDDDYRVEYEKDYKNLS